MLVPRPWRSPLLRAVRPRGVASESQGLRPPPRSARARHRAPRAPPGRSCRCRRQGGLRETPRRPAPLRCAPHGQRLLRRCGPGSCRCALRSRGRRRRTPAAAAPGATRARPWPRAPGCRHRRPPPSESRWLRGCWRRWRSPRPAAAPARLRWCRSGATAPTCGRRAESASPAHRQSASGVRCAAGCAKRLLRCTAAPASWRRAGSARRTTSRTCAPGTSQAQRAASGELRPTARSHRPPPCRHAGCTRLNRRLVYGASRRPGARPRPALRRLVQASALRCWHPPSAS